MPAAVSWAKSSLDGKAMVGDPASTSCSDPREMYSITRKGRPEA